MRKKLIALRKEQGYTQYTFSAACGFSRNHYSQIETGDHNPSLKIAIKIKQVLGYKDDDIFENTEE